MAHYQVLSQHNKYLTKIADLDEEEVGSAVKKGIAIGSIYGIIDQFLRPDRDRSYLQGILGGSAEGITSSLGLKYLRKELNND